MTSELAAWCWDPGQIHAKTEDPQAAVYIQCDTKRGSTASLAEDNHSGAITSINLNSASTHVFHSAKH